MTQAQYITEEERERAVRSRMAFETAGSPGNSTGDEEAEDGAAPSEDATVPENSDRGSSDVETETPRELDLNESDGSQ